jgi:hypothetical protein
VPGLEAVIEHPDRQKDDWGRTTPKPGGAR